MAHGMSKSAISVTVNGRFWATAGVTGPAQTAVVASANRWMRRGMVRLPSYELCLSG